MSSFVVVLDTPGIKQFVFGTNALAEVRGASSVLVRLNRVETANRLRDVLGNRVKTIYTAGGAAQFVIDDVEAEEVERAMNALAMHHQKETGGEVRIVWGKAELPTDKDYQNAVDVCHTQMRLKRETTFSFPTSPLLPFMMECSSTTHLPATGLKRWDDELVPLSNACDSKRKENRKQGGRQLWFGLMEFLEIRKPQIDWETWDGVRCKFAELIGEACYRRRGYVGLIYADGNAMGRLVQEVTSQIVMQRFSEIVDKSIHEACHEALKSLCHDEVEVIRRATKENKKTLPALPADIFLLGGDDLLVLLPADRALAFAMRVMRLFQELTQQEITGTSGDIREFFDKKNLTERGLTISCGVALAPAKYPFYLLLDLAQDLMNNAKKAGRDASDREDYWSPPFVDFHLIAGATSQDIAAVRKTDYRTDTGWQRTMRPYSLDDMYRLHGAVQRLRDVNLAHSKMQAFFEAALEKEPVQTRRAAREIYGRCSKKERQELWLALTDLSALDSFPWSLVKDQEEKQYATALADLVEAFDLFPEKIHYE